MAEMRRMPATAAEAEAMLSSGELSPAAAGEAPKTFEKNDAPQEGRAFKLVGKSDNEAEVHCPNGMVINVKRPDVATQPLQYALLAKWMPNPPESGYPSALSFLAKAILYVESINGQKQSRPTNVVEAQELMNRIGDENTDFLNEGYVRHFVLKGIELPNSER